MEENEMGLELHDRVTRGKLLTSEEETQLASWCAQQDALESHYLSQPQVEPLLAELQGQVKLTLAQLTTVSQRIQQVARENETLRQEISVLQRQVAQRYSMQLA